MHPAAPALHQHPLVSNLAMTTHLDAATVADMRRLLRNNLQSQRYSFDELFRVSHVLTNFSGLGDLLLTNFRPFGLGVVLRRISLQRSGPRASGLAPIEGAADSPVDAAVLGVLLERVAAAAACLSPHLITVLGYFVGAPSLPGSEADPAPGLYVVTELSDFGSISTMSFWRAPFPPARIRYIARCVLQALRYLHARGLAHGTLHAGHVFLNSRGAVKTGALFGATIRMLGLSADSEAPPSKPPQPEVDSPEEAKSDRREASLVRQGSVASVSSTGSSDPGVGSAGDAEEPGLVGVCSSSTELWPVELNTPSSQGAAEAAHADSGAGAGTAAGAGEAEPSRPPWLAPELSPTAAPTFAADVWAFGVLLLHLVSGVRPDASRQLVEQARSSPGQPWVANGQEVPLSPRLRDMVVACLREDPEARPGVAALLEHPFMEAERAGAGDAGDFAEWMRSAISEYSARKQAPKDPDLAEPSRARGEER
jgi:serine/threonine protein kinase